MSDASERVVRIFISSPGDVVEEREQAQCVIRSLQRRYTGFTLKAVLWEELALPATASFQKSIDLILEQQAIDVAVFILWSRLGSPLGGVSRPDGSPYRSGTEREFELMLAAFEQSGRKRPVILAYARNDDAGFKQKLTESPGSELEELIAQRKLAESFVREQFYDNDGHNIRALQSYREPIGFAQRLRIHLRNALDDLLGNNSAPHWQDNPYRGLQAFHTKHAAIFHGRDEETCELLQRLRDQRLAGCEFAVIVGASGSGKSSLARAGVAASLVQHIGDDDMQHWQPVFLVPAIDADNLPVALTHALAKVLPTLCATPNEQSKIASALIENPTLTVNLSVSPAFVRTSQKMRRSFRILLVLDQMEELWTNSRITARAREQFLLAIEALACSGHVAVLATLRSDFYPHAQQMETFLRLKGERGHFDLLPPGPSALARLIAEPARLAGVRFEQDELSGKSLDDVILQDAVRNPAALPLLQYTLDELWRRSDDQCQLTFASYQQLGGVEGALGKRAEAVLESLAPDARVALNDLLPLLVTVDTGGDHRAVRRRATLDELQATPARKTLTNALIAARFLITDREDDAPIASLAHEALLRRWNQVADWVSSNRDHLRRRARLEQAHQHWENHSRDTSLLLPIGLPLEEARQLMVDAPHLVAENTTDYVQRSLDHNTRQAQRTRRRNRIVTTALAILATAASVSGFFAWQNQSKAEAEQRKAIAARQDEALQRGRADREAAASKANANDARKAQKLAEQNAELADQESKNAKKLLVDLHLARAYAAHENHAVTSAAHDYAEALQRADPSDQRLNSIRRLSRNWLRSFGSTLSHDNTITQGQFTDDGRLVTCSLDKTMKIWDVESGALLHVMPHNHYVLECCLMPDSSIAATHDSGRVSLWNIDTGMMEVELPLPKPQSPRSLANAVSDIEWIPKTDTLAIGYKDGTVRLWSLSSNEFLPKELKYSTSTTLGLSLRCAPTGARMLIYQFATLQLWDIESATMIAAIKPGNVVRRLEFDPTGMKCLTLTDDAAQLWDLEDGSPLTIALEHEEELTHAQLSKDGKTIATSSLDQTVQLWDASGQRIHTLQHFSPVEQIMFRDDGVTLMTACEDSTIWFWHVETGQLIARPKNLIDEPTSIRLMNKFVVATGASGVTAYDHSYVVYDKDAEPPSVSRSRSRFGASITTPLRVIGGPLPPSTSKRVLGIWNDGYLAVLTDNSCVVHLWSIPKQNKPLYRLEHDHVVQTCHFHPNRNEILSGCGSFKRGKGIAIGLTIGLEGYASRWTLGKQAAEHRIAHNTAVTGCTYAGNGQSFATVTSNGEARVWSGDGDFVTIEKASRNIQLNQTGDVVSGGTKLWNAQTGEQIHQLMIPARDRTQRFEFVDQVLFAFGKQSIQRFSIDSGKMIGKPLPSKSPALGTAITHAKIVGGKYALINRGSSVVTKLHINDWTEAGQIVHRGRINEVAVSHDETMMATASKENTVRIWDVDTFEPLGPLITQRSGVTDLEFAPDGATLVVGSQSGAIVFWDVHLQQPIGPPRWHNEPVVDVKFNSASDQVVVRTRGSTLTVWEVPSLSESSSDKNIARDTIRFTGYKRDSDFSFRRISGTESETLKKDQGAQD